MATIGLSDLFYATLTTDSNGYETYGEPKRLAKAIDAELTIDLAEAILYADDGAAVSLKDFKNGTLTINMDDLPPDAVSNLTGASIDDNGVLISTSEDGGADVAIAFKARRPDNTYRFFWFYRVRFGVPPVSMQTKGDSITFNTPKIVGTVMRRNKPDSRGTRPWKAEVVEGGVGVSSSTITSWFETVYEPEFEY